VAQNPDDPDRPNVGALLCSMYVGLVEFFRATLPLGAEEAPEDLSQRTLLAAHVQAKQDTSGLIQNLRAYVIGIARHELANAKRRHAANRRRLRTLDDPAQGDFPARLGAEIDRVRRLDDREVQALTHCIPKLPHQYQMILILRYLDGLKNEAAAAQLGLKPAEASRIKWRAIARLKACVERQLAKRGRR